MILWQKNRGFTLIELVIVVTILSVLALLTAPLLQSGFNAYYAQRDLTDAAQQGSLALARIRRDAMSIPISGDITTASASQFSFIDNTNSAVSYVLSGTTLLRNGNILAYGVNSVSFAYYDSNGAATGAIANIRYVTVTLNITRHATDFTLFTTINLRNIV